MAEQTRTDGPSIEMSAKGIAVKGDAYKDLQPVVRTAVDLADSVLRVINNVVGIPTDYLNLHLETFRKRLQDRIQSIPEDKRTNPPLRVGCAVVKEVAYAAEEPDIQKMFADLLATSCNTDTQSLAHPGFASVITQLTPMDAQFLRSVGNSWRGYPGIRKPLGLVGMRMLMSRNRSGSTDFDVSTDNLVRLGILEKGPNLDSPKSQPLANSWQSSRYATVAATTFGIQFIRACMLKDDESGNTEETATENGSREITSENDTR